MGLKWKKIERSGAVNFPDWLEDDDYCYYAREYTPGGGYQASTANDLISNFKKSVDKKGKTEWWYKEQAIKQFARELSILKLDRYLVTIIPSSKCHEDPEYDSRLEDTLGTLQKINPEIIVEYPIRSRCTALAAHKGGPRTPERIYPNLEWVGIQNPMQGIALVDDVITSGAHFKACQRLILENYPAAKRIVGIFWAKTVWSV